MSKLQLQSAVDINFAAARYPLMGFRKVDGVRAGHITGGLTGRSLDPFKNSAIVAKYAHSGYAGFDGELTIDGLLNNATLPADQTLCGLTTGLVNRSKLRKGETELPTNVVWNLFDYLTPDTLDLPYLERYKTLSNVAGDWQDSSIHLLPFVWINNAEEAQAWIDDCLALQYEGAIFRDPKAMHKSGRATETLNDFWRFKPVSDKDAICTGVEEALQNNNEAKTNSRGRTERSSSKDGKVGNGMIGVILATDVETGQPIRVGPGAMPHKTRIEMFEDQTLIVGHPFKYTSLDTGVLDAPRQARYKCHRSMQDMS